MKPGLPAMSVLSACERLAQSRERLQQALLAAPASRGATASGTASGGVTDLKSVPGLGLAVEVARAWWARHPYRLAAIMVGDVAKTVVMPSAQRHPLALVAGAFLAGGLLAWSRPWRWLPTSALTAALSLHGSNR